MKKFFKDKDNLIIIFISLVAFIAGWLAIGPLKSVIIVGIADLVFFLPGVINNLKGQKKIDKKTNNIQKTTKVKKEKKKKKGRVWKILLFLFLFFIILGIGACMAFAGYIVSESPEFDPDQLYVKDPTTIYMANVEEIAKLGSEKRETITYDELPEILIDAIIATEDSNFFQHSGVDLARFLVASVKQVLTGGGGGASTLTMQVVKNTFTSTTSTGFEGIKRKFTDIYMSVFQVEKKYTKKEILEFYVNSYYLGGSSYGVEQACQTYFGKSAKEINLAEAALIAGLFQAPNAYDPFLRPERAEQRRNQVLKLMKRHEYITESEYEAAVSISVEDMIIEKETDNGNEWQPFIDLVIDEVITDLKAKYTDIEDPEELDALTNPYKRSMQIYITMDPDKQRHINSIMNGESYAWQNEVVDAGIAVVDVNTGAVVAVGAGRHRTGERQWNNASDEVRQIGSTSKPIFDYGTGIEYENWSTYNLYVDEKYAYSDGTNINNWDRKYNDLMTLRTALAQSRNVPALKAFQQNKNSNIVSFATSLGLQNLELDYNNIAHESHAIGGYEGETPLTMAAAYAAFGNGGYYTKPYSYSKIILNDNNEVIEPERTRTRVMSEETAYMMTSLLQSSAQYGLGNQYYINGAVYGAKTGTSNYDSATIAAWGYGDTAVNDLWVDGVSPDYSISVWYGYRTRSREYTNTAYTIAHRTLFNAVAKGIFRPGSKWTKPAGVTEVQVEMGSWPAALPSEYTPQDEIVTELFKVGTEPTEVSTKYSKLQNVENLTSKITDNTLTLSWNQVKTPDPINTDYLTSYFNSLYTDLEARTNAYNARLAFNEAKFGTLVYKVYSKKENGDLVFIKETTESSVELNVTTESPDTYVVKTSYTKFTANASDGATVKINLDDVKAKIKTSLTVKENVEVKQNSTYKLSTNDVKILADSKDVTSKAKITITVDGKTATAINTTKVGTYKVKYEIVYKNETYTLSRTVKVIKDTSKDETDEDVSTDKDTTNKDNTTDKDTIEKEETN